MRRHPLRLLITAGPTREPIDPVRFLSNYSTGVLGHTLVAEAQRRGHAVLFITGPTGSPPPRGVKTVAVETALQMQAALERAFPAVDAVIMAAAVADFRPARAAAQKIKRSGVAGGLKLWRLELVENPDLVAGLATRRTRQVIMGFALETSRALANARAKLRTKQLDAIVLTQMRGPRAPFGDTTVDGAIVKSSGAVQPFRRLAKPALARRILDTVERLVAQRGKTSSAA
ncbi:MAG: phosphopantothenoylcysteine decarboxylase [Candidatus Omnitrophica bacterium]|nr:phosphopantothenoylcysteine decarboxylase [Candidatus Omnitrophota bacterium]